MVGFRGVFRRLAFSSRVSRAFGLKLVCLDAVDSGTSLTVQEFPAVIGRGQDVNARLEDTWASRHHCEIHVIEGSLAVRDLGSRNGTMVNGTAVAESPLLPGDRLTVGLSTFLVEYDPQLLGTCETDWE